MRTIREKYKGDAFQERLHSTDWDKAIVAGVETTRRQRKTIRLRITAVLSLLLVATVSVGVVIIEEENARAQMYTMIEQFTSGNFAGAIFE